MSPFNVFRCCLIRGLTPALCIFYQMYRLRATPSVLFHCPANLSFSCLSNLFSRDLNDSLQAVKSRSYNSLPVLKLQLTHFKASLALPTSPHPHGMGRSGRETCQPLSWGDLSSDVAPSSTCARVLILPFCIGENKSGRGRQRAGYSP